MNPQLILSLWRERWGKTEDKVFKVPYLQGRPNLWSESLLDAWAWSLPGVAVASALLCAFLLALVVSLELSLNSQIVFSVVIVGISLYLRRYGGGFFTLVMLGLSFIASARYLYWRFGSTLSQESDMALVLGFGLCLAELYLWLLTLVNLLGNAYPLKRSPLPLPADRAQWPSIDVLIPCHDHSRVSNELAVKAALALDWPQEKIKIFLLEDCPSDATRALATASNVVCLGYSDNPAGKAGSINQALRDTKSEWVVILEGDSAPSKDFLTRVAGWCVSDAKLGMLHTAHHFLVPAPSTRSLDLFQSPALSGSCAMLRRSMLAEIGGVTQEPVTEQAHTALKLQAAGYGHACIGFAKIENPSPNPNPSPSPSPSPPHQMPGVDPRTPAPLEVFRVDHPFSGNTLRHRQRLAFLQEMLQFYYPVVRLIFFTAPLAYLLAGVNIIQTSAGLLAAYALPHLVQGYMAQARLRGNTRFPLRAELWQTLLALYLLVPTAITALRTKFSQWISAFKSQEIAKDDAFDGLVAWPYAIVLGLNLTGFMAGMFQFFASGSERHGLALFYLLWAGYNFLLLVAMLAVAEESRHIRGHIRRQSQLPATLRLPSGRYISCSTRNFPENCLALTPRVPVMLKAGTAVNVSIFLDYREFVFPAQVASDQENVLWITIESAMQTSYRALATAVFSRGPDWPQWLPAQDADHPFPAWLKNSFNAVRIRTFDAIKRLGKIPNLAVLGGWRKNKKKIK